MPTSAQHTMASCEPTVVVKQELEEDAATEELLYAASALPPINCHIKHEEPIHIKNDADCMSSSCQLPTLHQATSQPAEGDSVYHGESFGVPEFAESFVIYELEAAPTPAPAAIPTTTTTTSHGQSTPPPTLLNARLRKRARADATVAPYTLAAMETKAATATQVAAAPAKSTAELKVKCLCRLSSHRGNMSVSDGLELKQFFEKMFNETRRLTHAQQRAVKLTLLDAVCLAEDDMEAGKCCARCCT